MKCDETLPQCRNCVRRKMQCPGYERQLKWSTKYERLRPPRQRQASPLFEETFQDAAHTANSNERSTDELLAVQSGSLQHENIQQSPKTTSTSDPKDLEQTACGELQDEDQLPTPEADQDVVDIQDDLIQNDPVENDEHGGFDADMQSLYDVNPVETALAPRIDSYMHSAIWSYVSDSDDHADKLVAHYFDVICQVMSCFDSQSNPYRTDIPQYLSVSPHIFDCLMTMSAAHMANYINEYTVATLRYQTKAMSSLQDEMARLALNELATVASSQSRYQLLLGTIILGMTSVC